MRKVLTYDVETLRPYINWVYFDYAWEVGGKDGDAKTSLRADADAMLREMSKECEVRAVFRLCDANSDGDDILVDGVRLPMLRQQNATPSLCLADFVRPLQSGVSDTVGLFATTCHSHSQSEQISLLSPHSSLLSPEKDPYHKMLRQTLSDRLAEAAAEVMHMEVRRHYWGYAPNEHLTIEELHAEKFQGIRPAVGYPSLPDASINFLLSELLDMKSIGIRLTESGMMTPHASVCGLLISHPEARYFTIGKIADDQLRDYARRRGIPVTLLRRFIK